MTTAPREFQRRLGRYATGRPGPTVVVCGGLHGNEPAVAARVAHDRERRALPGRRVEVEADQRAAKARSIEELEQRAKLFLLGVARAAVAYGVEAVRLPDAVEVDGEVAASRL